MNKMPLKIKSDIKYAVFYQSLLKPQILVGFQHAEFWKKLGPNYYPTFEVFLTANLEVVTLIVKDQDGNEAWRRDGKSSTAAAEMTV